MPAPSENVKLREENEEICAAIKFSGYTNQGKIEKYTKKLMDELTEFDIQSTGKVRIARFDPPWKPGFIRHNELVVPINYQY
jgi:hypothetical protein